jgi:inosose dehydratase
VRKEEVAKLLRWGQLIRKCGGSVAVIGPNNVKRPDYVFADHKTHIVEALNDMCKALDDIGVVGVLHQHTGTCVETREETYAVMEAVDTRYLKFGPDIGQLQKGGSDPVQVVKDFLPLIHHMHLKDFSGGDAFLGYAPLGQGKVDIPAILTMVNGKPMDGMVMVELDSSPNQPIAAIETARIARAYLLKQGVALRG